MKIKAVGFVLILLAFVLAACGPAATVRSPYAAPATAAPATAAPARPAPTAQASNSDSSTAGEAAVGGIVYSVGEGKNVSNIQSSSRMIIKNGEITLQVKNTDVAIDGVTQIAGDLGGYIVSSRVWYQDTGGKNMKYSTITLGVPVDQFETMLRRLRGLAIKVVDETESGEDVTDQFVDLQSQLQNLQATRDRIREFLKNAKTVDEALKVNQELTNIEGQIEEIQGRMNYLQDRSAYSTITVTIEPQPPEFTPTPTATATATPTPVLWKPGETFNQAGKALSTTYKGIADTLIWLFVVVVPILLPPALIIWGIVYLARRKTNKQKLSGNLQK